MKKLMILAVLVLGISISSCTKSKEAKCKDLIEHMTDLTINTPEMKKMPKELKQKMQESMKTEMDKHIKECVKDFNEDTYKCMMKASKISDASKCDFKKK